MTLLFLPQPSARHNGSITSPQRYRSLFGLPIRHQITLFRAQIPRDIASVHISVYESPEKNRRILRINHPHKAPA
jgi:hypothetical protein